PGIHVINNGSPFIRNYRHFDTIGTSAIFGGRSDDGIDAAITQSPGVIIGYLPADCAIIQIFDRRRQACAQIHAGALGIFSNIVPKTITCMQEWCGSNAKDFVCNICPCLSARSWPLKSTSTWKERLRTLVPETVADSFEQKTYLTDQLIKSGVAFHNISASSFCTFRDEELFFSNARCKTPEAKKIEGRQLAILGIKHEKH